MGAKQLNGGRAKLERGKTVEKGSGYGRQNGRQAKHSLLNSNCRQHRLLNKAIAGRHSQQILRPAQASTNGNR